ncbi:MAG TPA: hypothetical protein VNU46_03510 [Gemmatimonadaceae bacterium]|nr:hypothetical protein [Gemmatimonadaceae bacterium]
MGPPPALGSFDAACLVDLVFVGVAFLGFSAGTAFLTGFTGATGVFGATSRAFVGVGVVGVSLGDTSPIALGPGGAATISTL